MTMEFILIGGKFIASTALLMLFYWLILRRKASYQFNRIYLITVPLLGAMMSGMTIEIPFEMSQAIDQEVAQIEENLMPMTQAAVPASTPKTLDNLSELQATDFQPKAVTPVAPIRPHRSIDYGRLAGLLFPIVSVILLLIGLYYIGRLLYIKSRMKAEKTVEGYDLIHSEEVSTPFSFAKTIFLPAQMDCSREEMIIQHEKAHIAHGHYIEVWVIELLTRLFWFNPVVWLCRSELRNVHEYQADHDVISRGTNVLAYQTTLLEMVLNESCPVVNGFNHSFIRQRFIEMKHTTAGTLSRFGKISMVAWIAILFCTFTFKACKPAGNTSSALDFSCYYTAIPSLDEPQMFVINGMVDPAITDSCYNIYIGDENFYIDSLAEPVMCVPIVDKKFRVEMPLKKVTAGRLRCIFPGNELCSAWIDLFFVPGETIDVTVHNGYYNMVPWEGNRYEGKVERAINAVRTLGHRTSKVEVPVANGKVWNQVAASSNYDYNSRINKVIFNKEATILHVISNEAVHGIPFAVMNLQLRDSLDNIYPLISRIGEEGDDNWDAETRTFGAYYCFEPIKDENSAFSLVANMVANTREDTNLLLFSNIHEENSYSTEKPNFTLHITASEGITDNAYLIRIYDKSGRYYNQVGDLHLDDNRSCTFSIHLDEERIGETICTFPDGSVCTHCERFPFVPGDTAELRVFNGYYRINGSGFYKEWCGASENSENASRSNDPEATYQNYLEAHGSERGCIEYYYNQLGYPGETLLKYMSPELKDTPTGKRVQQRANAEAERREIELKYANEPLYLLMRTEEDGETYYSQFPDKYIESMMPNKLEIIYDLVAEYKGNDPKRPWPNEPRSKNGVKVYIPKK